MKVLIVADVLGQENNGTTIACMNLVRYLQSQGDEVRILCPDLDKMGMLNYYIVPTLNLGPFNKIVEKNDVVLAKKDKKIIRQSMMGVDIVHIMLPFSLGKAALKVAKELGIPVTAGFHCQAENFTVHFRISNINLANSLTYRSFYKHLYKHVDAVHYPTSFIRDLFQNAVRRKTNGYVISNGVNDKYRKKEVTRVAPFDKHFNILFIGRFSKEKSHKILIDAVAKSKYKDNIQLVFAGQGPIERSLRKEVKKVGIIPPLMNFYSRDELVNIINQCDLYVHPAEIEIEAISCLEAITCGLVPVISDSPRSATNRFALDERNLFKNNNPEDLAKKIDYWIEHPKEKEECSKAYGDYTKQFDQTYCMEQMREMLMTYALREESHTSLPKRYYKDELNDDFANNGIIRKQNLKRIKYVHHNPVYIFFSAITYYIFVKPIIFFLQKAFYHQKFINKKKLKGMKKKGYYIYANHTADMGDAYTPNLLTKKRNYIVVSEESTSIPLVKQIVMFLGGLPVPSQHVNIEPFVQGMDYLVNKRHNSVTIYPEAHIWPYYTKIRDFKRESFRYPVDGNSPVFVLTNTYQKRKHSKKPKLVTYIDGPLYPDTSLPRMDAIQDLRDRVYGTMLKRSKENEQYETIRYIKLEK